MKTHFCKRFLLLAFALLLCLSASACNTTAAPADGDDGEGVTITLTFDGNSWNCSDGSAVSVDEKAGALVLLKPATYRISGTLTDGQIKVAVNKSEKVKLVLAGLTATSSTSAPLYIESADRVKITLEAGTVNELTDARNYRFTGTETKPNACLYSSDDLTIDGSGKLIVHGNYNNGIGCKNDVKIKGGTIVIDAVKNAVKGNDSIEIEDGNITVISAYDGLKTDADTVDKGYISIIGGTLTITCEDDALQATQKIDVTGGTVTTDAGGKVTNCEGTVNVAAGCLFEN